MNICYGNILDFNLSYWINDTDCFDIFFSDDLNLVFEDVKGHQFTLNEDQMNELHAMIGKALGIRSRLRKEDNE